MPNKVKVIISFLFFASFMVSLNFQPLLADEGKEKDLQQDKAAEEKFEYRQKLETLVSKEEKVEEFSQEIDAYTRYIPSSGVKNISGTVGIIDSAMQYSYAFKAFGKLPMEFSLEQKYTSINNSTEVKLPAHLIGLISSIEATLPLFNINKTYFRLGINPSILGDDWSFQTSRFRMPVDTLVIYQPNEKWTFLLGVGIFPDFRDKVIPIGGFIYKPNERLSFNIVPKRSNITYVLNNIITLYLEGDISFDEYEVDKDELKNVVLEYDEIHLGPGITYKVNKNIQASLSTGGIFGRKLQYRESLGKVSMKNNFYTEFRLEIDM